jgi:hypothetical protein
MRILIVAALLVLGLVLGSVARKIVGAPAKANPGGEPSKPPEKTRGGGESKSGAAKTPAADPADRRELERAWLAERPLKPPLTIYLFTGSKNDLEPLGGTLAPPGQFEPWKLSVEGPASPSDKGMVVQDGGKLISQYAGSALSFAIKQKGAFSLEAHVQPADQNHTGPARIAGLSADANKRNLTFGQEKGEWVVRIRTTASGENGTNPEIRVPGLGATRAHVVVTYDGKHARFFLNAQEIKLEKNISGALENWDSAFPLVLGNEAGEAKPWAGVIRFVALYDRALGPAEVKQAFDSLFPDGAGLGVVAPKAPLEKSPKKERPEGKTNEDF